MTKNYTAFKGTDNTYHYVYKITVTDTGTMPNSDLRRYYVGSRSSAVPCDQDNYLGSSRHLDAAVADYGVKLEKTALGYYDTRQVANDAEAEMLVSVDAGYSDQWFNQNNAYPNWCTYGNEASEETKLKLSESQKERWSDPVNCEAMSKRRKEFFADPTARQRHSEAIKLSQTFHKLYCLVNDITNAGVGFKNLSNDTKQHIQRSKHIFSACGGSIIGQEAWIDMYLKPVQIPSKQQNYLSKQFCDFIGLTKRGSGFSNMSKEAIQAWLQPSIRQLTVDQCDNLQYSFYF